MMAALPPNISLSMTEFNALLARRETAQMAAMATRWRQVELELQSNIFRLLEAIEARRSNNLPIGPNTITHLQSYRDLLTQVQAQARAYEDFAAPNIMAEQLAYGQLGIDAANAQIARAGVSTAFNRLNVAAIQNMVGVTADGSPLFDVLKKRALAPDMVSGMTSKLIEAVSLGYGPRKTADMMTDGLTEGLTKALTIARTEQIRVYRQATQDQYKATDFIEQMQRHAAPQERTCLACLALDGKIVSVDDAIESHPNCRCWFTPIIPGFAPPEITSGETWLEQQDEKTQVKILGAHYQPWKDGTPLGDMVKIKKDKVWGPTIGIVPARDLN